MYQLTDTISTSATTDGPVTITASKSNSQRRGIVTWTDGHTGPDSEIQNTVSYTQSVTDPIQGFVKVKISLGSMKIVKTAEDGNVAGIPFTISGNGVNRTVYTTSTGEIQVSNLTPGTYTVTEQTSNQYAPQESRQVTVVSGQTATVTFNNTLRRGDLTVTKTAEDGLVEGVKFHLYGTSLSGAPVDEYAVTDRTGRAYFRDVLIGTGYTLEEVDTAQRYVVPDRQSAAIEWGTVTQKSFDNRLKKWSANVTKKDSETGSAQGDASLAGATYGVFKGGELVDTYTTDVTGKFTTNYYPCGNDWSIR
ncbi:MAG: TonB-dependent receptor, partial [Oscillospiraceae bacterium]|nr:TonB-dependent receptor [Oscillospiraceae bacterium]